MNNISSYNRALKASIFSA